MSNNKHVSDDQLLVLLHADEDSREFRETNSHVENCSECQRRLDDLAGDTSIAAATRELLSDYPWHELSTCRELSKSAGYAPADIAASDSLDFLNAPSHPEMLGRLGRYEIERVIGAGGMGIVLKAFDTELNRPVAVKVLARHLSGVGAARQRFARESRAAAAVVHEHVVAIHNVEADQDVPYLVMQFVAGESLQDRVDRDGPLDVRQLLRIGSQIASGLTAAHEQGVVHRDVKPSNILLENGIERVLITDFGLARTVDDASLTRTGVIAGTPAYMSPEQANGDVADHQSDLFSLGSLIYFMATGHPPFRADRAMGVLNRICTHRHKPLWQVADQVPDELSVLVDQLLEKRPAKRIASAEEVHDRLAAILASVQQPRSSMLHRVKRWYYRYPRQLAAVGASVLVLSAAAIAVLSSGTSETNPASFEQPSKKLQPRDTTEPQTHVPANAFLVFDVNESNAFNESIESMHRQLDTLAEPVSISPVDQPNTTDLQSLLQRLEQLQQSPKTESPLN